MSALSKVLVQVFFFLALPVLGGFLIYRFGAAGLFLYLFLTVLWCCELFAFAHYRFCRQEELVFILQTAAATHAPVEAVLAAYLEDRPKEEWYRFWLICLTLFVFPGYYWVHQRRSYDARLGELLTLLDNGVPLDRALSMVPGLVSRQTALAVTVGQLSGRLTQSLQRLPEPRSASLLLETLPRLIYPLVILSILLTIVLFQMTFIIPKFERILSDFKVSLPVVTRALISISRPFDHHPWLVPLALWSGILGFNVLLFSSRAKWHAPVLSRIYRMRVRGEFLQTLGLMLETGQPLPEILDKVTASGLFPNVLDRRADRLALDLAQGDGLAASLRKHELATAPMQGLINAAERANNLPWALQELGDSLIRRGARLSYRITMVVFPLAVAACACLVAFVAVALFSPLLKMMDSIYGK